jgi:hypothetical protein
LVPVARDHQSAHQFNVVLVRSTLMAKVHELISPKRLSGADDREL